MDKQSTSDTITSKKGKISRKQKVSKSNKHGKKEVLEIAKIDDKEDEHVIDKQKVALIEGFTFSCDESKATGMDIISKGFSI